MEKKRLQQKEKQLTDTDKAMEFAPPNLKMNFP